MYLRAGALSFRRLDFRPFRTNWLAVGIDSLSIGRAAPSVAQVNPHAPFGRQERIILSVRYGCQQIWGYPQTHRGSPPDARSERADPTRDFRHACTQYQCGVGRVTPDESPTWRAPLIGGGVARLWTQHYGALSAVFVYEPKLDEIVAEADASVRGLR